MISSALIFISSAYVGFGFSLYNYQTKPCCRISTPPRSSSDSFRLHSFNPNPNIEQDEKKKSFQNDISEKLEYERDYEQFGPFLPIAKKLDEATGDWALSYADLHPSTPKTLEGQLFLATNALYAIVGMYLGAKGDFFFGALTELAGIVSFWYHFTQLELGKDRIEVRLALLTDYFTAGIALITGVVYCIQMGITSVPFNALVTGILSAICLSLCWVWEFGIPYIFWHSLWHIFSAYTGFLIGQAHLEGTF
jgi:hypothetical protein